jgi:hypothetical protein
VISGVLPTTGAVAVWLAVLTAEVMERALFFRAVDAPKMPGLPGSPARKR